MFFYQTCCNLGPLRCNDVVTLLEETPPKAALPAHTHTHTHTHTYTKHGLELLGYAPLNY